VTNRYAIFAVLILQAFSVAFFVFDIVITLLGVPFILSWQIHEFIQIGAVIGLLLGLFVGTSALRRSQARTEHVEAQLRVASGEFSQLLEQRFSEWGLTPAERDVALFAIKGMSLQDIARLRSTSEGTVKAQTNAIYRKADVSNRTQLVSLFIDELMGEALVKTV
jgi:DNA-binding CsgD family transcriptional regulator